MANIINWPESQVCIGCVNGLFVMSSDPSQYVCDLGNDGGSECEDRADPMAVLRPMGWEWICPTCEKWNELYIGNELPKEDYVQCNECDGEFKYE